MQIIFMLLFSLNLFAQNGSSQKTEFGTLVQNVPDSSTWIYVRNGNDTNEIISKVLDTLNQPALDVAIQNATMPGFNLDKLIKMIDMPNPAKSPCGGTVTVGVLINSNGLPVRARILNSDCRDLNANVLRAVMKMNYIPAVQDNKYISSWLKIPLNIHLK